MAQQAQTAQGSFAERFARGTRHGDMIFWGILVFFALVVVGLVVAIGIVTFNGSAEARSRYGLEFLSGTIWNPVENDLTPEIYGAWPAIRGTLVSSMIALIIAAPIAIGIGIFLAELCPLSLRTPLSFMVELLAAIPSVIYGVWGVIVFVPFFNDYFAFPISEAVGESIPWLAGPVGVGRGMLVAGIVLAIMILPTIAAITRDVLMLVPNTQREALLALGATKWEVIWLAVLPYARAGIIGGVMLGLGRALGETMAATMLIGNSQTINESLFLPATTAASLIANELTNANSDTHESALIYIALILFLITLTLNMLARLLIWYANRGSVGSART